MTYLDHAGATLYSAGQLRAHCAELTSHLYGNPHSQCPSSQHTSEAIEHARELVLHHFNVTSADYDVIFTSGCTAALGLLARAFPWTPQENKSDHPAPCHAHSDESGSHDSRHQQSSAVVHVAPGDGPSGEVNQTCRPPGAVGRGKISTPQVHYTRQLVSRDRASQAGPGSHEVPSVAHGSVFCYLEDNHTSVVGMREEALVRQALVVCATEKEIVSLRCSQGGTPTCKDMAKRGSLQRSHADCTAVLEPDKLESAPDRLGPPPYHLFAFPAQSNFSGHKYPLGWVQDIATGKVGVAPLQGLGGTWTVLLDAASFVSTSSLDLSVYPAHFVTVSFYKMFGFPTGLGALIVRSDSAHFLSKSYYGGGTVLATISRERFHVPRPSLHHRYVGESGF